MGTGDKTRLSRDGSAIGKVARWGNGNGSRGWEWVGRTAGNGVGHGSVGVGKRGIRRRCAVRGGCIGRELGVARSGGCGSIGLLFGGLVSGVRASGKQQGNKEGDGAKELFHGRVKSEHTPLITDLGRDIKCFPSGRGQRPVFFKGHKIDI